MNEGLPSGNRSQISRGPSQTEHPGGSSLCNPIVRIWKKSSVHFFCFLEWNWQPQELLNYQVSSISQHINWFLGAKSKHACKPVKEIHFIFCQHGRFLSTAKGNNHSFIHSFFLPHSTSLDSLVHKILPLLFSALFRYNSHTIQFIHFKCKFNYF